MQTLFAAFSPLMTDSPRAGYILPVFACAAAIAALRCLHQGTTPTRVSLDLITPPEVAEIEIEQVAQVSDQSALAIARSDPGDNLDLTRHTPIWAVVTWGNADQSEPILLLGGEGIGRNAEGEAAIYQYARQLFAANLMPLLPAGKTLQVTIILPAGRALAKRTSNEAFGIVEGLSLLGTTGIAQPLSAPGQLAAYRQELHQKSQEFNCLVLCVGENGLDLSRQLGINPAQVLKTANWLGPLLVEAGMQGVRSLLLFGYHGKLLKLAGGIFHTHHHVADARQEILTAHCVRAGLPTADLQAILASATAEDGLRYLRQLDPHSDRWVNTVYSSLANTIDQRSQAYIQTHSTVEVTVGTVLFDRQRKIIIASKTGENLLKAVCSSS